MSKNRIGEEILKAIARIALCDSIRLFVRDSEKIKMTFGAFFSCNCDLSMLQSAHSRVLRGKTPTEFCDIKHKASLAKQGSAEFNILGGRF